MGEGPGAYYGMHVSMYACIYICTHTLGIIQGGGDATNYSDPYIMPWNCETTSSPAILHGTSTSVS